MRLIDVDAIGIGICKPEVFVNAAYGEGWNDCVRILQLAPTFDAVPVVRCKDCKFSNIPRSRKEYYKEKGILRCDKHGGIAFNRCVYSTDFCSYGERSTDDVYAGV